jgi:RimJ/RimL family protein N-acetyltransferase
MKDRRRFNGDYEEGVTLRDGTPVRLRLVRPGDKPVFLEAWQRLSPESRYRRFLSARRDLSPSELRYLTEVDGETHLAFIALHGPPGKEKGAGVARFVRLPEPPDTAEAAVVVTDDFQGKGLATELVARLLRAALERGLRHVRCEVLAENGPVRKLIRKFAPGAVERPDGRSIVVEFDIASPAGGDGFRRVVALAARGLLALRRTLKEKGGGATRGNPRG